MRALIAILALIQVVIPLTYIAGGDARINAFLTNDDTYYYLQTAWNARHVGFVTFDGINATNGVQFLWFSVLYGLTFLTNDKSAFLALASTVAIVLTCLPYGVMWRLSSPRAGFMALFWFVICAYRPNQYLSGLESPLHASIIWLIVLQYVRIYRRLSLGAVSSSSVLFFVSLLVANTWTRLDSFGLSASFLALVLLTIDGPRHPVSPRPLFARSLPFGTYVAGALVIAAGTVGLFAFFQLAGGSLMPVSALVKGHHVDRMSLGAFYNWSLVLFPLRIQGANLLNILGIVAMFASVWTLAGMRVAQGETDFAALRLVALTLAVSVLIHSIATFGMFRYYYFWYLSATFAYWTITLAIVSAQLVERHAWSYRMTAAAGFVVAVPIVCLWWMREPPNNLAATRYEAAKWIDANLEDDAIVGSFNAGQLGYFSNRSVVNLDGLINNVTYFETVLRDESPDALSAYMDRIGIDYVADHLLGRWRELIEGNFVTIRQFGLASGGSVRVMKKASGASRPEPAPSNAAAISHKAGR
ncbi:MAG: hypothetical protein EHM55_08985 [Acidobacteria bacterium]|nr:MAG: hypothetical protein EHM55_08985 [Acidobacteriota bacterium]